MNNINYSIKKVEVLKKLLINNQEAYKAINNKFKLATVESTKVVEFLSNLTETENQLLLEQLKLFFIFKRNQIIGRKWFIIIILILERKVNFIFL